MTSIPTEVEVLRAPKERIETKGWWNGGRRTPSEIESTCLAIAIGSADPVILGFETYGSIVNWNDAPGRTKEEVLARLDERIAFYEAAEV